MLRPRELPASTFAGVAETCLHIAQDIESSIAYTVAYKRPAVGGLVWDALVAMTTAIGAIERGNSNFVTGRANVMNPIIGRLDEARPELKIAERVQYVRDLHTLEHAGQMRRGTYEEACLEAGQLLATLNSLLPAELRIESQRLAWLRDVAETQ